MRYFSRLIFSYNPKGTACVKPRTIRPEARIGLWLAGNLCRDFDIFVEVLTHFEQEAKSTGCFIK